MKQIYIFTFLILTVFQGYSQIRYEPGYFLDNGGNRTDCFIRFVEWKNNPIEIQYKLQEDSEPIKGSLEVISEFSILDKVKYVRADVLIDRSESKFARLSISKEPEFVQEKLFLKELINGKANLYSYVDSQLLRFFLSTQDSKINQLIYKKYKRDNKIRENSIYKKQLWESLKCEDISLEEIQETDYSTKELMVIFDEYNSCVDSEYKRSDVLQPSNTDWLNMAVKAGIGFGSLKINSDANDNIDANFGNQSSLRFGLELEAILPFNRNKWALVLQPMYQSYSADAIATNQNVSVDYRSLELSLGVRHFFFLNPNSKVFIGSSFILDSPFGNDIDYETSNDLGTGFGTGVSFTVGFRFADKFSIEGVYALDRSILEDFLFISSDYGVSSIVLGYTIF